MIDRKSIIFHPHLHTSGNTEFVCMYLGTDSIFCRLFQYPCCLLHREEPFIAEHIHIIRQSLCRDLRNHLLTYKIDVLFLPAPECSAHRMSTQKISFDGNGCCFIYASYDPEHLEFILESQAISALDFHCTCTHGHDLFDTFH